MRFFCTLILLFSLFHGRAGSYYISPSGSDETGNGTPGKPWRTLFKAASTATSAGDIIHVTVGLYTETEQVILAPGVSIEGEGINTIIRSAITADWKELLSLRSPEGTNGNQHISNLKFDGQNLSTFWCIYVSGRSNVSIYDCSIIDFKDRGVIFNGRNDDVAAAPGIYATGNKFYNNTVSNCAAYNTPNGIYGRGCLNIGGQEGMLIYNNVMTQNQRPNGYNGYLIKYQNDGYLKGVKLFNNTLTKIPFAGNYGGDNGWDFAVEFWNILGGMEIYGNKVQGSIDLVNTSRGVYAYGIWIHDNTIQQQVLNSHFESGLIFEVSTESVIVEKNVFHKISGGILFHAQENTVLNDIVIRNNRFEDIGRNAGNGNNGNGININCGTLLGNENHYSLSNFTVYNNFIGAAPGNAPFYGIEITGAAAAVNIKIQKNSINNFAAACFVANPAFVIDSLIIEDNTLSGNGNRNDPFYVRGTPGNYSFRNNVKTNASGPTRGFNFRQEILRPLYHEMKNLNPLELIALISFLIFLWFAGKEEIYAYTAGLIYAGISIFQQIEQPIAGLFLVYGCFVLLCIYGWIVWSRRDGRNHRITRITSSSKKELVVQFAVFIILLSVFYLVLNYGNKYFANDTIATADAFIYATSFTGMWLVAGKKRESWCWWAASFLASIPTYYLKHYLLLVAFSVFLFATAMWNFYNWKKRKNRRKKHID